MDHKEHKEHKGFKGNIFFVSFVTFVVKERAWSQAEAVVLLLARDRLPHFGFYL